MKKIAVILAATAMFLGGSKQASADTDSGTLTVTGTIQSSIGLTIESAAGSVSGAGTGAVTAALGNIARYDVSAPSGFSLATGASDWTLSANVGVKVEKANITSDDYTLTAQLNSAPASGVAFKLNGSTLSESSATTLTSTGAYGSTESFSWDIVIANSAAAGSINNVINFVATAN